MLFASPTGYEKVKNIGLKMPSKCPTKMREGTCPNAKAATFFDIHRLLATLKISTILNLLQRAQEHFCWRKKENRAIFFLCPVLLLHLSFHLRICADWSTLSQCGHIIPPSQHSLRDIFSQHLIENCTQLLVSPPYPC